jgi:hypothetical protein
VLFHKPAVEKFRDALLLFSGRLFEAERIIASKSMAIIFSRRQIPILFSPFIVLNPLLQVPRFSAVSAMSALFSSSLCTHASSGNNRLVYGKDDSLFGSVEERQGAKPFGNVLDAGTGMHSLRWIATLGEEKGMTGFTAITADKTMQRNVQNEADALEVSHLGKVLIGNWFGENPLDEHLLSQNTDQEPPYDTILADYLIGAMDGFSPYQQDLMIPKLAKLLKPGGRLYLVGLEPIPDTAPGDANIICKIRQIRDACILLAGDRCYREYPVEWIERKIQAQEDGTRLTLLRTTTFPILYRHSTIVNQINVAMSKFPRFPTPELANQMKVVLDDLEAQSLRATTEGGRIRLGFDYVVTAEKQAGETTITNMTSMGNRID